MTASALPARLPAGAKTSSSLRVFAAFSSQELAAFWPEGLNDSLPGANVTIHLCDDAADPGWEDALIAAKPDVLLVGWAAPALSAKFWERADPGLRYICFVTGSVRRIVPRAFIEQGGFVTNWGESVSPMVAEHALLLLLAALRRLPVWPAYLQPSSLQPPLSLFELPTRTLMGRTVSLHGFGLVARELIRLLAPFAGKIRAYSHGVPAEFIRRHGAEPVADLDALFNGAELLVSCEALNAATLGSVGARQIESLAPDAIFVNVGRGPVVDEEALARRAATGQLHLGLDVFHR